MKVFILILMFVASLAASSVSVAATTNNRTQFDCRKTVRIEVTGTKYRHAQFVKACPHAEPMKAGKCVTNIWGQMRCLE
jgi:hypothetical protein